MIKDCIEAVLFQLKKCSDEKFKEKTFEDMVGKIEIVGESNIDEIIEAAIEFRNSRLLYKCADNPPKYDDFREKGDKGFMVVNFDNYEEAKKSWIRKNRKTILNDLKGQILMVSREDNTIPDPVMEFISATFNAERIHLG
jgi:hypothetical protein